jgi:hypothetical protein
MADETKEEAPEPVRRIVGAMVNQALARCDREGIAWEDFYRAMLEEQARPPKVSLEELFERIFRRLKGTAN